MADEVGLATKITEATEVLHDPRSTPQMRQAANEFILQVTESPVVLGASMRLVGPEAPAAARFFAFKLIATLAAKGALAQDPRASAQLGSVLVDMIRKSALAPAGASLGSVPGFVREKFAQALAAVVVHATDWPGGWPQLQTDILEAGRQSPIHAALALTFFRDICEVLQSDSAARLSAQRRKALQTHLADTSAELFAAVGIYTRTFPNCAELDRAAVLLAQDMSGIVPVLKFLASDIDHFLHQKLSDGALRNEVLQAFSDLLTKDIAKDLRDPPDRMKQFLWKILDLASFCRPEAITAEDYDVHKAVAILLRDFVEANKPSLERHADLQAKAYESAVLLLRYPSVFIQTEAASIIPHVIRANLPNTQKGGVPPAPLPPPAWLRLKAELLPLIFLSLHKEIPANFELFPLPAGFQQCMALTCEFDMEEDLTSIRVTLKGRSVEIMMAMTPAPQAILESLEFVHELLPRVLGATASIGGTFASYEAALGLVERIMPSIKPSAGAPAIEACRMLLSMILSSPLPGSEHEYRRLEFLSRVGAVFDLITEHSAEQGSALIVQAFLHFFKVIEVGTTELRTRALYSFIGVSKSAQKSIRPVLEDIVAKAAGLLNTIPNGQHVLCESLVTASTAAKNFDQQSNLLANLLSPILARWSGIADSLIVPENFVRGLLENRSDIDALRQIVLCLEGCFRSSVVPAEAAVATAGGFSKSISTTGHELNIRNPAGTIVTSIFPRLVALARTFHCAFPSDMTRPMVGIAGTTADSLRPYLLALDKEEVKALTSSLDTRNKDPNSWANAFPPPPGEDPEKVFRGRHLLYLVRIALYRCIGSALGVQDGILTNPELPALLSSSLLECMEFAHPYHLELQLRGVWLILFGPNGMSAATEPLRISLAVALLPKLLSTTVRTLDRYWQWLQLPDGHPAGVNGDSDLHWAMCTGTVMASRTFMELVTSLVIHGGPQKPAQPGAAESASTQASSEIACDAPRQRKGKNRANGQANASMGDVANASSSDPVTWGGKQGAGFAGIVFQVPEVLEAVQGALCSAAQWKDPKTIGHALVGMHAIAVRLMSGGEAHQNIREVHAASTEAPQRCNLVLRVVLQPVVSLCNSPPTPPPGDGALHTILGKPFSDFFSPENQQGRVAPSPFAVGIISAIWPILYGMCQIFMQVCKRNQAKVELQHIAHFPALSEACQLLASLRRVSQKDVQDMVTTLLESGSDPKLKRGALRTLIRTAVDPAPAHGETLV